MHSFVNCSVQYSLRKPVYRYSGQSLYAVHEFIDESHKMVHQSHEKGGAITGYPTGLLDLDQMLCGLQPGTLTVIASRPSNGKSSLAMNIALNLGIMSTAPTALFSLEQSKEQVGIRLLSAVAHVDICRARTGHLSEPDLCKLDDAKETLRKSTLYVDDTSGISITELLAKAIRLKVDHNIQVIIIDYLQLMRDDSRSALDPTEISRISSSLKVLARELGVAIILLSQLHSSVDRRKAKKTRPKLSDLGNTGSLEDDADVILLIYRESVYCKACRRRDGTCVHNHEDLTEIIVAKHKNGPIGTVYVNFHAEMLCFSNLC